MTTASALSATVRALWCSGLLGPTNPVAALRTVGEIFRGGTNLYTLLAIAAARYPDRAAIIDDDGALTYRELRSMTESVAHQLCRAGVGAGQAVGVMCRNGRNFVTAAFGAALVGADVVLVNTEFRSAALTGAMVAHQIQTMVCDGEFTDRVRRSDQSVRTLDPGQAQQRDSRPKVASPGRMVLLTSGTTGVPKGVPRTPRMSFGMGVGVTILERTKLAVGSRVALAVPMFHGLGLGILLLTVGLAGTVLTRRRFDAEATLAQASLHRADAMTAVPIMLARILDLPQHVRARNPVPALRVVISSGDRLDPSLARRFMDAYGDVLYNLYGSTEVGIGALATPAEIRRTPETVGRPVLGCPVRIFNKRGRPVGPRVIGRIFVGGELTCEGHSDGDANTVIEGMSSTGDLGYLDESGRLYVVGREDDMIVSGGENVYPRALENALAEHPAVAENTVVGVPDEQFGHRLAAYVVLRPRPEVDVTGLREYLKDKVSRFEQPRDIHIVASIPRNPAGKVLRRELSSRGLQL
ncbi:AMP-binding protein [Mycobacterium shinjukuense]|uniref:Acyl-CoA synthetase n=2 Tax=Mycobacterium shinjukuense TaxID=398694 RepID=A0A7I7MTY9_9MYCO|nr:AMP-binding protein [Mycobacterium shinjukuense]MCV6983982.1 AMP-binding protein [Mycobacterium shinjukuense]ORB65411.1 acyl-CoA synthetase [Mycobacterium shinjukuense]BBX75744.1 acyl-CoA synthetase [Mycobacterium shinjukuense]